MLVGDPHVIVDRACTARARLLDRRRERFGQVADLAAEHGLRLYSTDDAMSDHARRSTPGNNPFLTEFMAMDMDERWVSRSPTTMLETFHWFRGARAST
jgi:hypothetical protein